MQFTQDQIFALLGQLYAENRMLVAHIQALEAEKKAAEEKANKD